MTIMCKNLGVHQATEIQYWDDMDNNVESPLAFDTISSESNRSQMLLNSSITYRM